MRSSSLKALRPPIQNIKLPIPESQKRRHQASLKARPKLPKIKSLSHLECPKRMIEFNSTANLLSEFNSSYRKQLEQQQKQLYQRNLRIFRSKVQVQRQFRSFSRINSNSVLQTFRESYQSKRQNFLLSSYEDQFYQNLVDEQSLSKSLNQTAAKSMYKNAVVPFKRAQSLVRMQMKQKKNQRNLIKLKQKRKQNSLQQSPPILNWKLQAKSEAILSNYKQKSKKLRNIMKNAQFSPPQLNSVCISSEENKNIIESTILFWKSYESNVVPESRQNCSFAVLNEHSLMLFGGLGSSLYDDCFILDLKKMQWREVKKKDQISWPRARYGHSATPINDKIYIFGGQQRYNEKKNFRICFNDLLSFDSKTEKWGVERASGFTMARAHHAAVRISTNILIHGGVNKFGHNIQDCNFFSIPWIDLPIINPQQGPGPISYHSATAIFNNQVTKQTMRVPRHGAVFFFGGKKLDGFTSNHLFQLSFQQGIGKWRLIKIKNISLMPSARMNSSFHYMKNLNKILLFGGKCSANNDGGYNNQEKDQIWSFNIQKFEWQVLKLQGHIPITRFGHNCTVLDHKMYLLGGISQLNFQKNDLYVLYTQKFFQEKKEKQVSCQSSGEFQKAYYKATGQFNFFLEQTVFRQLTHGLKLQPILQRFNPKRLVKIQKAIEDLQLKQLGIKNKVNF